MMPGRAFVEVERLHAVGAARRQIIGVVIEDAGARAVRIAGLIGAGRGVALAEALDLADLQPACAGRVEKIPPIRCSTRRPIA